MVNSCCAYNCTNRWGKLQTDGKRLPFHRFPLHDPVLLMKWIIAVKRKDWRPAKSTVICAEHFTPDDYRASPSRLLKKCAVPSVFNFPSHLQPKKEQRKIKPSLPVSNQLSLSTENSTPTVNTELTTSISPTKVCNQLSITTENSTPTVDTKLTTTINPNKISLQPATNTENPTLMADTKLTITFSPTNVPNQFIMSSENPSPTDTKLTVTIRPTKVSDQFMSVENPAQTGDKKLTTPVSPTVVNLRKKVKMLQSRLLRRDKKIKELESMLSKLQKCSENVNKLSQRDSM